MILRRSLAVSALVASIAAFVPSQSASATSGVTTQRLNGDDRYATAAAVATTTSMSGASTAILATGENYPDALAASSLAGASAPAPILLTTRDALPSATSSALSSLRTAGLTTVVIVGGTGAVSDGVADAVRALGLTVNRVAGADRYATAAAIATAAAAKSAPGKLGGQVTALVATGENYPDALSGGVLAYASKLPLLLVSSAGVPQATRDALSSLGVQSVVILGGTTSVSTDTQSALESIVGSSAIRLAGSDRYATAAAVGEFEITAAAFPATSVALATGTNYPDALSAGPFAGQSKAPILLTASLPESARSFLTNHSTTITKLWVVGGTGAVGDDTVTDAQTAATGTAPSGLTARPELLSASITQTVSATAATASNPAGTTVQYLFDDPITSSPSPGSFKVYRYADGTSLAATSAAVDATNSRAVNALFSSLTTTDTSSTGTGGLSVATVALAAVTNGAGLHNPEGAAPLTPTSAAVTGATSAPDLLSIGRFGATTTANVVAVDFTFDQAAFTRGGAGSFSLILTDGTLVSCTPPASSDLTTGPNGAVAGGNGTTTITALCGPITNGPPTSSSGTGTPGASQFGGSAPTASNTARGIISSGAVASTSTGSVTNPAESTTVSQLTASSPTLTGGSLVTGTTADSAVYTFDQAVLPPTDATKFKVFMRDGTERTGTASTQVRNTNNVTQVSVDFPLGTAASAAGVSVVVGAVQGVAGGNIVNQPASFVVNGSGTSPNGIAGKTVGPDLTGVAVQGVNDAFGNLATASAIYTFDAGVTASVAQTSFALYTSAGARMNCTTAATTTTDATLSALQVRCTAFVFTGGESGSNVGTPTAAQVVAAVEGGVVAGAVTSAGSAANPEGGAAVSR